jgi:hypothetical protein
MAEGWGPTAGNHALTTETALYTWIQLHTAAPGAAGTTAVATENTRKQVTWGTASAGVILNATTAITWTGVAGTEQYTKCTFWTAVTAGTFGFSGTVTASAVTAGDTFTIAIGGISVSLTLAS